MTQRRDADAARRCYLVLRAAEASTDQPVYRLRPALEQRSRCDSVRACLRPRDSHLTGQCTPPTRRESHRRGSLHRGNRRLQWRISSRSKTRIEPNRHQRPSNVAVGLPPFLPSYVFLGLSCVVHCSLSLFRESTNDVSASFPFRSPRIQVGRVNR